MDVKATAKTVRVTPRKARLVLDLIRGKSVEEALAILKFTPNKAAAEAYKVVKSAAANAVQNTKTIYIKEGAITANMSRHAMLTKASL